MFNHPQPHFSFQRPLTTRDLATLQYITGKTADISNEKNLGVFQSCLKARGGFTTAAIFRPYSNHVISSIITAHVT